MDVGQVGEAMTHAFLSEDDIPLGFWRWPRFSPQEMRDRLDGSLLVVDYFMDDLEALRTACDFPLPVSSAYRTPEHNQAVSSTHSETGPHTLGVAVDIAIPGSDPRAYWVLQSAFKLNFTGIEVTPDHIHLDMAPSRPDAPRPMFWIST